MYDEGGPRRRNPLPGELDGLSEIEKTAKLIEIRETPLDRIPKEILDQIPKATLDRIKQKQKLAAVARRIYFDYSTQTDAEGHFAFKYVRPGKAKIGRQVKLSQEGMMSSWANVNSKPVEFVAGQTSTVNLHGPDQSVIRKQRLAEQELRERKRASYEQDAARRDARTEAAGKVLLASPPAAEDARLEAAMDILGNCQMGKNERLWATAIRELITHGKPALPKLIAKLDATEDNGTLRDLGFVLRGIGDPRAVPALIRAIPRLYPGGGSDCGLRINLSFV